MVYAVMTIGIFICIYPFESAGLSDVPNHQLKGLAYKSPIKAGFNKLVFAVSGRHTSYWRFYC